VELAETDLDKYHFVFKRYIPKIKSAYYHAYYNKKNRTPIQTLFSLILGKIIASKFAFFCVILR